MFPPLPRFTLLLAALALSACGQHPRPRTARTPVRRVAGPVEPMRARTVVVPPIGAPQLLHQEPGGASYYAVGGMRVRLREGETVVGEQPFASPLVGAALGSNDEWWFVTADGTVARATDFVGTLRRVESLPSPVLRGFGSGGGLVAVLANGQAWRVGPGGGALPSAVLESPEATPLTAPDDEAIAAAEAAVERMPASRLALDSSALLSSGEVAMEGGAQLFFVAVTRGGGFTVRGRTSLNGMVPGECGVSAWGTRALLTCPSVPEGMRTRTPARPYLATAEGITAVGPAALGALIPGRDGATLTRRAPCPGNDERAELNAPSTDHEQVTRACTLDRERGWREWEYPGAVMVLDVFESNALVVETREQSAHLWLYYIDAARTSAVRLSDPAVEIARAGFTPDGRIVVLAHSGPPSARRSQVGVGAMGTTVMLRPVGFFAQDVTMVDSRRGLVVGLNANDVAETQDGGLNWLPVLAALDGDPKRVSLVEDERERDVLAWDGRVRRNGERVQCSALACRAAERLVHWWGEGFEVTPAMQ